MSKRKLVYSILMVLILAVVLISVVGFQLASSSLPTDSAAAPVDASNGIDGPNGPLLVVPENPFGVLGLLGAFASAFAVYSLKKKK